MKLGMRLIGLAIILVLVLGSALSNVHASSLTCGTLSGGSMSCCASSAEAGRLIVFSWTGPLVGDTRANLDANGCASDADLGDVASAIVDLEYCARVDNGMLDCRGII